MKTYTIKPRVRCHDYSIVKDSYTVRVTFHECFPSFLRKEKGVLMSCASNKGWYKGTVDVNPHSRTVPNEDTWSQDISRERYSCTLFMGFYHQLIRFASRNARERFEFLLASPEYVMELSHNTYSWGSDFNSSLPALYKQSGIPARDFSSLFAHSGLILFKKDTDTDNVVTFSVTDLYKTSGRAPYTLISEGEEAYRSVVLSRITCDDTITTKNTGV